MSRTEYRLTGNGGQGIILASIILAEAAILSGKYTTQSQSYGPEARGGACKAEVLVSDEPIYFTKVRNPNFLMALTQKALDTYLPKTSDECLVLVDSNLSLPETISAQRKIFSLPIIETAQKAVGKIQTANIVAVSCINEIMHTASKDDLTTAVLMHIPKGTEELNIKALSEGYKIAETAKEIML